MSGRRQGEEVGASEVGYSISVPRRLPLWITAVALVHWGWEASALALAVPLAALVIAPWFVALRWGLTRAEFHRAADVCWVLGIGGLLLIYSQQTVGNVLRTFAQWLPVIACPALLAQVWSQQGSLPASALLPLPRWRRRQGEANPAVDVSGPFVALCLLSASASGGGRPWFYVGAVVVLMAGLCAWRPRDTRLVVALVFVASAAGGGWFVALGLGQFQQWVETGMIEWSARWGRDNAPSRESHTSIGRTGRVGGSSQVILRIRDEGPRPMPHLFRVAGFSQWQDDTWYATGATFQKVEGALDEWVLDPNPGRAGVIGLEWVRGATRGLLPLPATAHVVRDLPADVVERNALGAVRVDIRSGVVSCRVEHAQGASWEREPYDEERQGIPTIERPAIEAVATSLDLGSLTPPEIVQRVRRFFREEFRYTTDLKDLIAKDPRATTPLGRFLLGHRAGHCEYFATAAALLVRSAGVPSRYVTGYLIDPDAVEKGMVTVRESQAHAWVRVWVDGSWTDFDPTPPVDLVDETQRSWGHAWARRWHKATFAVARWWWLGEKRLMRQAHWLALPLLAGLLWRFRRLRAAAGSKNRQENDVAWVERTGLDSEWYNVERCLDAHGWRRRDREPAGGWKERLRLAGWNPQYLERAVEANRLHEQFRFDPRGLSSENRTVLRELSQRLLESLPEIGNPEPSPRRTENAGA